MQRKLSAVLYKMHTNVDTFEFKADEKTYEYLNGHEASIPKRRRKNSIKRIDTKGAVVIHNRVCKFISCHT